MEFMLWSGRPDPPIVWETESHYRRRKAIPFAVGLVLLGPLISSLGFWILLRENRLTGPPTPFILEIGRIFAPAGVALVFAGIAWLLLIAMLDYWDDRDASPQHNIH